MRSTVAASLGLTLALFAGGCAENTRAGWMIDTLVQADAPWWDRRDALAGKYAEMAEDRYAFFRGSAPVFWADVARPGPRDATAFIREPDAAGILLIGDAHPENFGTNRPDGALPAPEALAIEAADLDGAAFGPWIGDLRRSALGIAALIDPIVPAVTDDAVAALADGYIAGVRDPAIPVAYGRIVERLRSKAAIDGVTGSRIAERTADERFVLDAGLTDGSGLVALNDVDRVELGALIDEIALPPGARILDQARRYGAGVASRAAIRYLVLWDRGDPSQDDDDLLGFREVIDPPNLAGHAPAPFDGAADRVVAAARRLWSDPHADPRLSAVAFGARSFKVQSGGSFFQTLDRFDIADDLAAGDLDERDLVDLAGDMGRWMGAAHARARTADGHDAQAVLLRELGGHEAQLTTELIAASTADLARLDTDWRDFADAESADPLLGIETIPAGVPR